MNLLAEWGGAFLLGAIGGATVLLAQWWDRRRG